MQLFGRTKKVRFAVPEDNSIEQEGLVSKEADTFGTEYRQLQRKHRVLKRWVVVLSVLLALTPALFLFFINPTGSTETHNTPVPDFPIEPVTFQQDDSFAALISTEADNAWGAMMPIGDGFIVVDDPRSFELPPGKSTSKGEVYDTAVFHQLHCLAGIRIFMSTMKQAIGENDTLRINKILLDPRQEHMEHCFDYLRQSLMCHGDMTLEWPRTEPDGRRFAVDGWGIEHQCASWTSIMEYVSKKAG